MLESPGCFLSCAKLHGKGDILLFIHCKPCAFISIGIGNAKPTASLQKCWVGKRLLGFYPKILGGRGSTCAEIRSYEGVLHHWFPFKRPYETPCFRGGDVWGVGWPVIKDVGFKNASTKRQMIQSDLSITCVVFPPKNDFVQTHQYPPQKKKKTQNCLAFLHKVHP